MTMDPAVQHRIEAAIHRAHRVLPEERTPQDHAIVYLVAEVSREVKHIHKCIKENKRIQGLLDEAIDLVRGSDHE